MVKNRLGASQERQAVARHLLDADGRGLVVVGLGTAGTRRPAAQRVAVDLPDDPPVLAVVELRRVDDPAARVVADQRLRSHFERALRGVRRCDACAAAAAFSLAGD